VEGGLEGRNLVGWDCVGADSRHSVSASRVAKTFKPFHSISIIESRSHIHRSSGAAESSPIITSRRLAPHTIRWSPTQGTGTVNASPHRPKGRELPRRDSPRA
jgi:hypothetical protein